MKNIQNLSILHFLISFLLFLVSAVLLLIPEPGAVYVELFGLALIPIVLCSIMCGTGFGFVAGALAPVLSFLLWKEKVFMPDAFVGMVTLAVSGFITGVVYKSVHYPIPSVIIGIVAGRIAYGAVMMLYALQNGAVYPLEQFYLDAVEPSWPGLILCCLMVPILVKLFTLSGVMAKLGNEPAGKEKEIVHRVS